MRNSLTLLTLVCLLFLTSFAALAQEPRTGHSGLPVPRFVNLKNSETWGRLGPSFDYPVRYIFKRQNLPVKVIAETRDNVWRQVEDPEGMTTWVHRSQLVSSNMVMITRDGGVLMRRAANPDASGRAILQQGVIVRSEICERRWCRVRTSDYRGWVPQNALWGTN